MTVREMIRELSKTEEFKDYDRIKIKDAMPEFDEKGNSSFIYAQCVYFPKADEFVADDDESWIDTNEEVEGYKIKKVAKNEKGKVFYKYDKYVEYYTK